MTEYPTNNPTVSADEPAAEEKPLLFEDGDMESPDLLGLDEQSAHTVTGALPGGKVLLLVVLAVAGGSLYLMRLGGTAKAGPDAGARSAEKKISQALAAFTATPDSHGPASGSLSPVLADTQAVLARFADDPTDKQVRPEQLKKNPFAMRLPPKAPTVAIQPVSHQQQLRQQRLKQLRQEVDGYVVQTVMTGRTPMAVVSGKVVREGDRLGSFRVAAIEQMSVVLSAEGNTYRLQLNPLGSATEASKP